MDEQSLRVWLIDFGSLMPINPEENDFHEDVPTWPHPLFAPTTTQFHFGGSLYSPYKLLHFANCDIGMLAKTFMELSGVGIKKGTAASILYGVDVQVHECTAKSTSSHLSSSSELDCRTRAFQRALFATVSSWLAAKADLSTYHEPRDWPSAEALYRVFRNAVQWDAGMLKDAAHGKEVSELSNHVAKTKVNQYVFKPDFTITAKKHSHTASAQQATSMIKYAAVTSGCMHDKDKVVAVFYGGCVDADDRGKSTLFPHPFRTQAGLPIVDADGDEMTTDGITHYTTSSLAGSTLTICTGKSREKCVEVAVNSEDSDAWKRAAAATADLWKDVAERPKESEEK